MCINTINHYLNHFLCNLQTRWGGLSAPSGPLAAIWGLLLRGGEERKGGGRKKGIGRGGEREKRKGNGEKDRGGREVECGSVRLHLSEPHRVTFTIATPLLSRPTLVRTRMSVDRK